MTKTKEKLLDELKRKEARRDKLQSEMTFKLGQKVLNAFEAGHVNKTKQDLRRTERMIDLSCEIIRLNEDILLLKARIKNYTTSDEKKQKEHARNDLLHSKLEKGMRVLWFDNVEIVKKVNKKTVLLENFDELVSLSEISLIQE